MSDVSWNTTLSLLWLIQAVNLIGVVAIGGIETGESVQLLKGANLRDTQPFSAIVKYSGEAMFEKLVRWTPNRVYKWEQIRQAGRKRYVWRIGVLGWGGLMFLVVTPLFYIQQYGATWPSAENLLGFLILVLASAAIWLIGGYWFGSTMWSTMERAYRRHQGESLHE